MALGGGMMVERVLRLVRTMILTRLLEPEIFGVMALVSAVIISIEAMTDAGIRLSVIQNKRGGEPEFMNVAWWFQVIRGVGLFALSFLAAPLFARFYENTDLVPLLRVAFLSILVNSLISPRYHVLEKQFQFRKWIILFQAGGILGTVTTVVLAFYFRNAWALVMGFVVERLIRVILSNIFCFFRPSFHIDRESVRAILRYARGIFGLSLLTHLAVYGDIFVLGKCVLPAKLGVYSLAYSLAEQPLSLFSQIIGRILMPAFSEKQDDAEAIRRVVWSMIRLTVIAGVPLCLLGNYFSKDILGLIYGAEFISGANVFCIMCATILFRSQGVILGTVYLAMGRPELHRRYTVLLVALVGVMIYPATFFGGILGAAYVILISNIIAVCMQVLWMNGTLDIQFRQYLYAWLGRSIVQGKG